MSKQYDLYLEQRISFCIGCEHKNSCHFKKFAKLDSIEDYQEKIWKEPLRITKKISWFQYQNEKLADLLQYFRK